MAILKFFKLFKYSFSSPVNDLSNVDRSVMNDMGIAAPYATAFSLSAPFVASTQRV